MAVRVAATDDFARREIGKLEQYLEELKTIIAGEERCRERAQQCYTALYNITCAKRQLDWWLKRQKQQGKWRESKDG